VSVEPCVTPERRADHGKTSVPKEDTLECVKCAIVSMRWGRTGASVIHPSLSYSPPGGLIILGRPLHGVS
jgi:hypothetical protein